MKKLIIVAVLLLLPSVVIAKQSGSPKPSPINVGQVVRQRAQNASELTQEMKDQIREQHKEQIQAKLTERRQNRIRTFYGRLNTRIDAAADRLQILSERIETRLGVLEGEGEDTTALETKVDNAQALIGNAQGLATELETMMEEMIEAEDPKSFMPTLKDSVKEIKDILKDAHSILVEVITEIKGLRIGNTSE